MLSSSPAARLIRSLTVTPLNLTGCWKAKLMPNFALSVIDKEVISSPLNKICPSDGVSIPAIILARVDLPPPFGPVITINLPSSIVRLTFLSMSFY